MTSKTHELKISAQGTSCDFVVSELDTVRAPGDSTPAHHRFSLTYPQLLVLERRLSEVVEQTRAKFWGQSDMDLLIRDELARRERDRSTPSR